VRDLHFRRKAQESFAKWLRESKATAAQAVQPTTGDARPRIYAAGPLGFTPYGADYQAEEILDRLKSAGFEPSDPWDTPAEAGAVYAMGDAANLADLKLANQEVGQNNIALIRSAAGVLAILDGTDVDSGTASEIGYAAALGIPVVGLRLDSRVTGDNRAAQVNLQVEAFIEQNDGTIARTLDEAINALKDLIRAKGLRDKADAVAPSVPG
jgi:nucleoside 2-deoxyribosyltransferase